jgi:hypothetical protein
MKTNPIRVVYLGAYSRNYLTDPPALDLV